MNKRCGRKKENEREKRKEVRGKDKEGRKGWAIKQRERERE